MLCEWHILHLVLAHGRKEKTLIVEEDSRKVFIARFSAITASPTCNDYETRLTAFKKDFQHHQKLLDYIQETWWGPWAQHFVRAYADQYSHFGNRATFRVESRHSN